MEIVFIEHYDSFSHNVIEWIRPELPKPWTISTVFCDDRDSLANLSLQPKPMVLSPGPGHPGDYPLTLDLVRQALGKAPILGICLGHQILALAGGASIIRSQAPFHGTCRGLNIRHPFFGISRSQTPPVAVYHSLVVQGATLPPPWRVLATDSLGETAAIEWPGTLEGRDHLGALNDGTLWPAVGLQFHPESFMSLNSEYLIQGWLQRDVNPWSQQRRSSVSLES